MNKLMQRSTRPKSAKGKVRPTPPSHPRPRDIGVNQGRSNPKSRTSVHSSDSETSTVIRDSSISSGGYSSSDFDRQTPTPQGFPSVPRPTSSLSKYRVLPKIPQTPTHERGCAEHQAPSPAESEIEYDLLSSFAQQMILDSAKLRGMNREKLDFNLPHEADRKQEPHVNPKVNGIKKSSNTATRRQHETLIHGSPKHKKIKTSSTKSVFLHGGQQNSQKEPSRTTKGSTHAEPSENKNRIKLALKLPDGKRVERFFLETDKLEDVMGYAQTKMKVRIRHCNVYSMLQVPKVLLGDWKRTLADLNILDRTVLYIEEKD